MEAWLLSLVVTLAISLSSLVPGAIDQRLSQDLTTEVQAHLAPQATATAHVEGDPLLQLPFGVVPHLTVHLHGLEAKTFPLSEVRIDLTHVHVSPWTVLAHQPAKLLEPADALVAVRFSRGDLQAALLRVLSQLRPDQFTLSLPLIGRVTPHVVRAEVALAGDRINLVGDVALRPGAEPRHFEASVGLAVVESNQVQVVAPQLVLGAVNVPAFLLAPMVAGLPPLVRLADLALPAGRWTLEKPVIEPTGVELRAHGNVTTLTQTRAISP